MNAGHQTTRRLVSSVGQSVCRACRHSLSRNSYATAAAAVQTDDSAFQHVPPVASTEPQASYAVKGGVLLSRPPQITRDLHPFEAAYFLYQRRLNERLALPFTRYFYIKKRSPADLEWKRKLRQRLTPARDIGRYKGYGDEAWNDEVLVGANESDFQWQVQRLVKDAEQNGLEDKSEEGGPVRAGKKVEREPVERPLSRVTEADTKGDLKSLNRLLQRTLYLLVKDKEGHWVFPQDRLDQENLHTAAERILKQSGGINMNTWVVGNVPVGQHQHDFAPESLKASPNPHQLGYKTFFMKARIMAGQPILTENKLGLTDFKWLAKEEVQKAVRKDYWQSVKNMLTER
ncbi:39S mitochondrial ribosomal protein L46-domain-containing protein [Massariosphaeria phaeospora]|uniref:Large ribosomal subunit protein mL46 n=1 Tax=Massariosphaeria phaeospora TaxID=100035 RepID=A0A7C8IB86_9PLEO|nr:39S mitochondrial ribosomal protein L46-domain-containing protein [Massariosphaeria phaeospora]